MSMLGNWQTWGVEFLAIALILVIALLLAITALLTNGASKPRRWHYPRRWGYQQTRLYPPSWRSSTHYQQQRPDLSDPGQQLDAVIAGSFKKRRVLNSAEYRVFAIAEEEVKTQQEGYRVFAQTSLGEILTSKDDHAFRSINSKRVDILIIDRSGWPVLAVEYQGNGHYQGTAVKRDAVKKEALRKAGVRYLEFTATDTYDQIRSRLREHLVHANQSKRFERRVELS